MKNWGRSRAIAAAILGACTLLAMTEPGVAGAAKPSRTFYVDCAAGNDANPGTSAEAAWRTLTKASTGYLPGDTIRFKAGTSCTGTFAPRGSGTKAKPITATSYGTGAKPVINGGGATAAVLLHNVEYWALSQLNVSNTGPAPVPGQQRVGVYVLLEDFGTGHHYSVTGVDVHDVNGCDCEFPPSGGILFFAGGAAKKTGFDSVSVTGSTVTHVDRVGIGAISTWLEANSVPMPGISFTGNQVTDTGGEGIVVFNGVSALVANNVIKDFSVRSDVYTAGAYAWNSLNTVFRRNEVSGGRGTAMAFSLDEENIGTIIEYNYSHDNKGGFLFVASNCTGTRVASTGGVARYNISQNDAAGDQPPNTSVINMACETPLDTKIYNNTLYAPNSPRMVSNLQTIAGVVLFTNNIFSGRSSGSALNDTRSAYKANLFQNIDTLPSINANAVYGDPKFLMPGTTAGYSLRCGSAAIDAGVPIANNGGFDYFGFPVAAGAPVNIGAYGYRCLQL